MTEEEKEKQRLYRLKNGEKLRARARELYAQNRKHILENKAMWRANNPDKVKEMKNKCRSNPEYREKENAGHRQWNAANTERVAKYSAEYRRRPEVKKRSKAWLAEWHKKHPEARGIYTRKRKAIKYNVGGSHTAEDIRRLYFLQKGKCVYCQVRLDKYHVDHIIPLSTGGSNSVENIQILCPACNMSKHTKHPDDFMRLKGLLQ